MTRLGRDRVSAETDITFPQDATDMRRAWEQEANPAVQETIRAAMQQLAKDGKPRVTKKHILKVLFLARERLPDDSHIKQDLAYYWYMEGPYSEVVDANMDHMVDAGMVVFRKTARSETYSLASGQEQPATRNTELDDAKREIGLVASANPTVRDAIQHAYEAAPFKWYTTYNLEFGPNLGRHFRDILAGRESRYSAQNVLEQLDDVVLDYPTDRAFMGHRAAFMDYAKMLNAFLRWDSYHTRKDMVEVLYDLCERVWDVFAWGARIRHHDPYYDERVDAWDVKYKQELTELDHTVRGWLKKFDEVVVDEMEVDPEVLDMVLHPEKYEFAPLVPGTATRDG